MKIISVTVERLPYECVDCHFCDVIYKTSNKKEKHCEFFCTITKEVILLAGCRPNNCPLKEERGTT